MPRKKAAAAVVDAVQPAEPPTPPEPPKPPACERCGAVLTWRDALYGVTAREADGDLPARGPTCKRCHARDQRQVVRGVFTPAIRTATTPQGKRVEALVRDNRAMRRRPAS